ncbi:hypothetical protein HF086_008434 [Spodoptera exigua]|uniref:Microtubule-associated protein 1B/S N-terminal domain-containing protein n=1 Tax=Spodoptera exigua TaxID=7107 RepID=A0A922MPC4_SPOEX|nr:hypothetical protein HF086_008434 [Spodoptera exigua]
MTSRNEWESEWGVRMNGSEWRRLDNCAWNGALRYLFFCRHGFHIFTYDVRCSRSWHMLVRLGVLVYVGERLIQFASENLVTEILIHPQMNTLMQCMRNLLSSFTRHRHLVHAGYTFAGNGSWIMQDGTFSLADFTDAYQENEVQRVIRAYENSISIDVHCSTSGGGEWAKLPEMPFVKYCKIRVNPTDILDSGSQAIKDFIGQTPVQLRYWVCNNPF